MEEDKAIHQEQQQPEFNGILKGLLILMLVSSIGQSISKLVQSLTLGTVSTGLAILMFALEMVNVVFFFAILRKKSWGLLAFFGMLILQIPLNLLLGNAHIEDVAFSAFIRIAIVSLLFLIPKNGITGWRVLFPKKEHINVEEHSAEDKVVYLTEPQQTVKDEPEESAAEPAIDKDQMPGQKANNTKSSVTNWLYKGFSVPVWAILVFIAVIIAGVLLIPKQGGNKRSGLPDYYYQEIIGINIFKYHLDPKCEPGLNYAEAEEVYGKEFYAGEFCINCISAEQLSAIRDSCEAYAAKKEAEKIANSIRYRIGDKTYNIPKEKESVFLKQYPDAERLP